MSVQHYLPQPQGEPGPQAQPTRRAGTQAITVNGREISRDAIDREVQHHPAPSIDEARRQAVTALVVRELLIQRAEALGPTREAEGDETAEEAAIARLIEQECDCPAPSEEDCRRYFEANRDRFRTPDAHEVSHIFLPAPNEDETLRAEARNAARNLISQLDGDTGRFAELARAHSRCPSREQGGHLGLITRGQTAPEFERALSRLPAGEINHHPLETRYGFHVVLVHQRAHGEPLPFDAVRARIAAYLSEQVHRRAVSQYVQLLAGQAAIHGIDLEAATTPLVQ
jgi:peptidyl-prolyl cis-trans isomerase C